MLAGQSWATTTILRQDDNQTTECYESANYFQFDFNNGAYFEISYNGEVISTTECNPIDAYSATFGVCLRNFVNNGSTIEFDLLDGEYSTTEFAHYVVGEKITATAENGTVSGAGTYKNGQTITLTVTPNDDCEFRCWSDGNTDNPRSVVVNGYKEYKAFCLTEGQSLSVLTVSTGVGGRVSDGCIFRGSDTTLTLQATPDADHHFLRWSDGITDNPRTLTVSADKTLTAEFEEHTIVIDVAAEPPTTTPGYGYTEGSHCSVCNRTITSRHQTSWGGISATAENGNVSGAGIYATEQTVTLTVTPDEGCVFRCWNDGNTSNPRTVVVDYDNKVFKAFCLTEGQTLANLTVSANTGGTAKGGGVFVNGSETTFTLQAIPNYGYHFLRWSDGNTDNPRNLTVSTDKLLTAEFEAHTIAIDAAVPAGTKPGLTQGSHCSVCNEVIESQQIIYVPGVYRFEIHGEDYRGGNDDRFIESDNGVYSIHTYETDANSWDSQFFVVFADEENAVEAGNAISLRFQYKKEGGAALSMIQFHTSPHNPEADYYGNSTPTTNEWQTYDEEHNVTSYGGIRALAFNVSTGDAGMLFLRNIAVKVNGNEVFKTNSTTDDVEECTITTASNNNLYGSAEVIGETIYDSDVTLKATPATGYHFVSWNDDNTDNPRTITVSGNATYTANFAINSYNVKALCNVEEGNTYCNQQKVDYGTVVTFYAIPKYGYYLKKWSNNSTDAVQSITISSDSTLTAYFEKYPPVIVKDTVIHDTIKVEVPVVVMKDTTIHDTIKIEVNNKVVEYIKDTIVETVKDTIIQTVKDTIIETVKDTITVTDTIYITKADTVFITKTDTIYITKTDTVYIEKTPENKTFVIEKQINLNVWPNPTTSFVTVGADAEFSYILTDANGKLLRKEENAASYTVDLSEYADGIYLLHTSDGVTHKIVKQ